MTNPHCNARVGYDGASGVGTPSGLGAFRTTVPTVRFAVSAPRRARRAIAFTMRVRTVVAGSAVARRVWNWGDRSGAVAAAATAVHRYARPGTYAVRVTVTDTLGQRAAAVRRIAVS